METVSEKEKMASFFEEANELHKDMHWFIEKWGSRLPMIDFFALYGSWIGDLMSKYYSKKYVSIILEQIAKDIMEKGFTPGDHEEYLRKAKEVNNGTKRG